MPSPSLSRVYAEALKPAPRMELRYVDDCYRQFYLESAELYATTVWAPSLGLIFHYFGKGLLEPPAELNKDQLAGAAHFQDDL